MEPVFDHARALREIQNSLDSQLAHLKSRLAKERKANFEQNVQKLKERLKKDQDIALEEFNVGMAGAHDIKNPRTREAYEKSLRLGLEITLNFQKKLLDDFIERWGQELG